MYNVSFKITPAWLNVAFLKPSLSYIMIAPVLTVIDEKLAAPKDVISRIKKTLSMQHP